MIPWLTLLVAAVLAVGSMLLYGVATAAPPQARPAQGPIYVPLPTPVVEWHAQGPGYGGTTNVVPPAVRRALERDGYPLPEPPPAAAAPVSAPVESGEAGGNNLGPVRLSSVAESQSLRINVESPTQAVVSWPDNGRYVGMVNVYRDDRLVASISSGEGAFVDTGLSPNTRYTYTIQARRANGSRETIERAIATLASVPVVALPMEMTHNSLLIPITNDTDPYYTEYRAEVWLDDVLVQTTPWRSERCIPIKNLDSDRYYRLRVYARNLDGVQTDTPTSVAGENPDWALGNHTAAGPVSNDAWAMREIDAAADIYRLTDDARDWMRDHVQIIRMRGEPGWAGAWRNNVGIGHSNPKTLMHEVMHVFWTYWDGFPESCDRMNLHTFRRDVLNFIATFENYDNEELDNPLEPWRPYFGGLDRSLQIYGQPDEPLQEIIEREEYHNLWHTIFHMQEADVPIFVAGKPSLLPSSLRKYFVGFLKEGMDTTWEEEVLAYRHLHPSEAEVWNMAFGTEHIHGPFSRRLPWIPESLRVRRVAEPLRAQLETAAQLKLVDFFNTLPDLDDSGYFNSHNTSRCRSGRNHIRQHMALSFEYLEDLPEAYPAVLSPEETPVFPSPSGPGAPSIPRNTPMPDAVDPYVMAAQQQHAVIKAWEIIVNGPLYSERYLDAARQAIADVPHLPPHYQQAFENVLDIIRRAEYGFFRTLEPNFDVDAEIGPTGFVTSPLTADEGGLVDFVVAVDDSGRIQLEWKVKGRSLDADSEYSVSMFGPCWNDEYSFAGDQPSLTSSGLYRVTWPAYEPGLYHVCLRLDDGESRDYVCQYDILVPAKPLQPGPITAPPPPNSSEIGVPENPFASGTED